MMRLFLSLLLSGLFILALPACATGYPSEYAAEAIEAWVIDAETKQPLEGVIVVAHWELEGGIHLGVMGDLEVLETVTDKNGRFHFPAWGPKKLPRGLPHNARLTANDPELLLFKGGYKFDMLSNPGTMAALKGQGGPVRRSQWNRKTIELSPFKVTAYRPKYEDNFESFNGELERIAARDPKACGWKKIPNTIRAMNLERRRMVEQGVNPNTLSTIDNRLITNDDYFTKQGGCGSPKEFFGGFQ